MSSMERNSGKLWGGSVYYDALRPRERAKLNTFYRPHNEQLYQLLGRRYPWEHDAANLIGEEDASRKVRLHSKKVNRSHHVEL